jgi:hypothetical protein
MSFSRILPRFLTHEPWQRLDRALAGLETCLRAPPAAGRIEADTAYVSQLAAALRDVGGVLTDEQLLSAVLDRDAWDMQDRFDVQAREFLYQAHPDATTEKLAAWMRKPTGENTMPGGDPVYFRRVADVVLDAIALMRHATNPDRHLAHDTSVSNRPAGQAGAATATKPKKKRRRRNRIAELLLALLDDRTNCNLNMTELAGKLGCHVSTVSRACGHPDYRRRIRDKYERFGSTPPSIKQV